MANSDIPARLVRLVDSHSSMEVKLEACRALLQISVNRSCCFCGFLLVMVSHTVCVAR